MIALISQEELEQISKLCREVPEGAIAEVGVYQGVSLKAIAEQFNDGRPIYGFDTFCGIPEHHWNEDEVMIPGTFDDTSRDAVLESLKGVPNLHLVEGIFPDTITDEHRNQTYALVHLDCDYYVPTRAAIEFFWPRMAEGGVIVFHDYHWHLCRGVDTAIEQFGLEVVQIGPHQCYARKPSFPKDAPKYGALCYVHTFDKAKALIRNLQTETAGAPVEFFTDGPSFQCPFPLAFVDTIGPFIQEDRIKDNCAFVAFREGIKIAASRKWDWFFWLEWDCRIRGRNWLQKLWSENMAWPHDHVCAGTPVIYEIMTNGSARAIPWLAYAARYAEATGRFPAFEGWDIGAQAMFPNGALAFYKTKVMEEWFGEMMPLSGPDLEEWCLRNVSFDHFIGRKIITLFGDSGVEKMAWLPSAYSGCGNKYYTEEERLKMLDGSTLAVHQVKNVNTQ